jgi:hypothetical protein
LRGPLSAFGEGEDFVFAGIWLACCEEGGILTLTVTMPATMPVAEMTTVIPL